jgi:hypothetical protein
VRWCDLRDCVVNRLIIATKEYIFFRGFVAIKLADQVSPIHTIGYTRISSTITETERKVDPVNSPVVMTPVLSHVQHMTEILFGLS